jgi:hypothetical protein
MTNRPLAEAAEGATAQVIATEPAWTFEHQMLST